MSVKGVQKVVVRYVLRSRLPLHVLIFIPKGPSQDQVGNRRVETYGFPSCLPHKLKPLRILSFRR